MKKLLITAALIATATTAAAENVTATITYVEPRYQDVYYNVPRSECRNVEVPVYGTVQGGGATGGDVLAGMIIGGILGKGVTGKDQGAAAGAVMGGVIAADQNRSRQVITGYRTERQCSETMIRETRREIKDYFIRFEWRGHRGSAYTYNQYRVGDGIPATVTVRAN